MAESLFSPSWYRVKDLRPRLRRHARIHRHFYRGQLWYVLQDPTSGRHHRFNPAAYTLIGLMNGRRTVQELWEQSASRLGDDMPTQDEVIQLLGKLHQADVLQSDISPDTAELFSRFRNKRQRTLKQQLSSPLSVKLPLYDPDRLVDRLVKLLHPAFSRTGFFVWLAVTVTGLVLAVQHWSELSENVVDRVLATENLLLLWVTFPVVKAIHEFGHALAVKRWGGEVHEMGIMLLVFMPVPYVDASASSAFVDKRRRMIVAGAGMMVELFIAALAMFMWLNLEPGLARAAAFNAMLIAGVSTLLFNANPLLRFDGYYMLADYLEIPNLASRSNQYIGALLEKHFLGATEREPGVESAGEGAWFIFYGIAAFCYRIFIAGFIVTFIAGKYFVIGVVLAIWAAYKMVVAPVIKPLWYILFSERLRGNRHRVYGMLTGATLALTLLLFVIPVPMWTMAEGVVRLPEEASLRSESGGFVDKVLAAPDRHVRRGEPILQFRDPELLAQVKILQARLQEAETRYNASLGVDRNQVEQSREEIRQARLQLADAQYRLSRLLLRSPEDGKLVIPQANDLPGRYVPRGALIGYVLDPRDVMARVVVDQGSVDLVRQRVRNVEMRLAENTGRLLKGRVVREVPAATYELPSDAMSVRAGGRIALDPRAVGNNRSLQAMFVFDIALPPGEQVTRLGQRVQVRFYHGTAPVAWQLFRRIRQLFLSKFDV